MRLRHEIGLVIHPIACPPSSNFLPEYDVLTLSYTKMIGGKVPKYSLYIRSISHGVTRATFPSRIGQPPKIPRSLKIPTGVDEHSPRIWSHLSGTPPHPDGWKRIYRATQYTGAASDHRSRRRESTVRKRVRSLLNFLACGTCAALVWTMTVSHNSLFNQST